MIRCIAIEDEPLALKQIEAYIDKTPGLEKMAVFPDAFHALEFVAANAVDLMFVDIQMPDLNGLDFVRSLENPPRVIFTTAFSDYAVEGFKVDAIDYLLKPIGYPDFLKAVNKARDWFSTHRTTELQVKDGEEFLFIKSDYKLIRINLRDIRYIEGMNEYVRIHLSDSKPVVTLLTLKLLEEQLPSDQFMRVHRSYIVRLDKIMMIDRSRIVFDAKVYIPVSDPYKEKFQRFLDANFLATDKPPEF